jgi:hypothetical protein
MLDELANPFAFGLMNAPPKRLNALALIASAHPD